MARIRTIKPEFPLSESIGRLSRDARLLFIQLWTICDDEGRTRAASRVLASLLYPFDTDAPSLIEGWLSELEVAELVVIYTNDGNTYLQVNNWRKHQKIDRPSASRLPAPDASTQPREHSRGFDALPSTLDLGSRIDIPPSPASQAEGDVYPKDFELFWNAYPRTPNMSKREALDAFNTLGSKLPPIEALLLAVERYKSFLKTETERQGYRYPAKHANGWLQGCRWEGFIVASELNPVTKAPEASGPGWDEEYPTWSRFRRRIGEKAWDVWFAKLNPIDETIIEVKTPWQLEQLPQRYGSELAAYFQTEITFVLAKPEKAVAKAS